jgi:hypothetical protein
MPIIIPGPSGQLTLEALKRRLDRELSVDDDKLQDYLDAAFAQAQAPAPFGCGRLLVPGDAGETRTVKVHHQHAHRTWDYPYSDFGPLPRGRALIADASVISSVVANGSPVTDYDVVRHSGYIVQITGLDHDIRSIDVTGTFGFSSMPANLVDAIYVLAARMSYEEAAQYADQVSILEGTAVQSYYRQLPPRVKLVFGTFTVPTAVAGLA